MRSSSAWRSARLERRRPAPSASAIARLVVLGGAELEVLARVVESRVELLDELELLLDRGALAEHAPAPSRGRSRTRGERLLVQLVELRVQLRDVKDAPLAPVAPFEGPRASGGSRRSWDSRDLRDFGASRHYHLGRRTPPAPFRSPPSDHEDHGATSTMPNSPPVGLPMTSSARGRFAPRSSRCRRAPRRGRRTRRAEAQRDRTNPMLEAPARAGTRFLNPATKVAKKTVLAPCLEVPLDALDLACAIRTSPPPLDEGHASPPPIPERERGCPRPARGDRDRHGRDDEPAAPQAHPR